MSTSSIGYAIIDEITKQRMFSINYPDPDVAHVFVWSSGAAEQLEALVAEETASIMRGWESDKRVFRGALQLLKEAGLAPGSAELIAACERFDATTS